MQFYQDYLGNCCNICGATEGLQIDHIDPKTKKFNIGSRYDAQWAIIKPELDKCQLLCVSCHKDKHAKISAQEAYEIFHSEKSVKWLMTKYKVSKTTIYLIKIGVNWKEAINEYLASLQ